MEFLSNGFQQLFNDLEQDLTDFTTTAEDIIGIKNQNSHCDYYSYVDNGSSEWMTDFNEILQVDSCGEESYESDLETCLDYLLPSGGSPDCPDFDWETGFLDNFVEIQNVGRHLPDKTFLCSDSCDLFLKESSENLNKFLGNDVPPTEADDCDRTFPCTFGACTKVYAKPAHLRAHLRRHMGEKPYVCTWPDCSWKFSRSDELARHRRSHSGVKPYKCTYCTKCFARSDHLAKHRKVHERRIMAASQMKGFIPASVLSVRPGRKPKNQFASRGC